MSQNFRDPKNVENLIQALGNKNYKAWSSYSFQVDNTWAVDPFIEALSNKNPEVRRWAAFSLGKIKDGIAISALVEALGDEDKEVSENATTALINIGESVIKSVIAALESKNEFARQSAIFVLKALHSKQALKPLTILLLKDPNFEVRLLSASALGELKNQKAVGFLIQALRDENPFVVCSASEALGKLGNKRAIKALLANLNNKNALIRYCAVEALGEIGGEPVLPFLRQIEQKDTGEHQGLKVKEAADRAIEQIQRRLTK